MALSEIRFVPQYGPAQPIELVALSSNGLHALTAAGEGGDSAGLWDLETGTLLRTFTTDGRVTLLGFTRDDRRVIVGGAGGKVAFHDVGTGAVVSAISLGRGIRTMAISPDRTRILAARHRDGESDELALWHANTGVLVKTLAGPRDELHSIDSVAFAPDGARAASSDDGGTVRLWALASAAEIRHVTMPGEDPLRTDVAFSGDGRHLVGASWLVDKGTTYVWDVSSGREEATLDGHGPVAFAPRGQLITVDSKIRLWDLRTKELVRSFGAFIHAVAISQDGRWLFAGRDRPMLYDLASGATVERFTAPRVLSVSGLAFSPDGKHLIVAGSSGDRQRTTIASWDLAKLELERTFPATQYDAQSIRVSAPALTVRFVDPHRFLVLRVGDFSNASGYEHWLAGFDLASGRSVLLPGNDRRADQDVTVSDDGGLQVFSSSAGVQLYDALTGQPRGELELPQHDPASDPAFTRIEHVDPSPDGRRVLGEARTYVRIAHPTASGPRSSRTQTVVMWDRAGHPLITFAPRTLEQITVLRWSPDNAHALVGVQARVVKLRGRADRASAPPAGNTLEIWDVERRTFERGWNAGWVADARFLHDGKDVLVAGFDGLTLWNVGSGKKLHAYRSNTLTVELAISPDERFAAATCNDGSVRLWQLDTGASVVLVSVDESWVVYDDEGRFEASHVGVVAGVDGVTPRRTGRTNRFDELLARMGRR